MLTFAVPDLHGRLDLLEAALAKIEARSRTGTVVFLGDYVDRGPDSKGVVERLMLGPLGDWQWVCLQGNHEHMMVRALREHRPVGWLKNGGGPTLLSYGHVREGMLDYNIVPEAHLDWLAARPIGHLDRYRIFVHAGLDHTLPLNEQNQRIVRSKIYPDDDTSDYAGRHVVHGHRPAAFVTSAGRTALDIYGRDRSSLLVAVFDDSRPGGPIEIISVSEP